MSKTRKSGATGASSRKTTHKSIRRNTHPRGTEMRRKLIEIVDNLPENYADLVCLMDPELDTPKGRARIRDVKSFRRLDEHIIDLLEKIADEYTTLQNNLKL
jgi:hypothetical protein